MWSLMFVNSSTLNPLSMAARCLRASSKSRSPLTAFSVIRATSRYTPALRAISSIISISTSVLSMSKKTIRLFFLYASIF